MFAEMVSLWVPKSTSAVHECQDVSGYHAAPAEVGGAAVLRAVVADGATTGFDAQSWAAILVEGVFEDAGLLLPGGGVDWLAARRTAWADRPAPADAPWYVGEAFRRGSAATLLALAVEWGTGRFVAVGRGDSCLLHVRDGAVVDVFPAMEPEDFGLTPPLVRTVDDGIELDRHTGSVEAGDSLLLVTDALAHAALTGVRDGSDVCRVLGDVGPDDFAELCGELRASGAMDDDDVTLLRLATWTPAPA